MTIRLSSPSIEPLTRPYVEHTREHTRVHTHVLTHAVDHEQIWPRSEVETLFHRIVGMTNGQGDTAVVFRLTVKSTVAWASNRPTGSDILRTRQVRIQRIYNGHAISTTVTGVDDETLQHAITQTENRLSAFVNKYGGKGNAVVAPAQGYTAPALWSDTTFHVTDHARGEAARTGADDAMNARLTSAGKVITYVMTWAIFNTNGLAAHVTGTRAIYSETVRDQDGVGTGWAGISATDWTTLDVATLARHAREKCVSSAHPQRIEPGRYTAILEPEATASLMLFVVQQLDRESAEAGDTVYSDGNGQTKIGTQVLDSRVTISTDPNDPECPYIPFNGDGFPYQPTTWIENGILKALSYDSIYAQQKFGTPTPKSNPCAFRMSGGDTRIDQMIASTERGLLVTRFADVSLEDPKAVLVSGCTCDGLWLVEHGKIKTAVKDMYILESPMFIGNKIEQLGIPAPTLGLRWTSNGQEDLTNYPPEALGGFAMVVPPMKVRDFNFGVLTDAV